MTYQDCLAWIHGTLTFGIKPGVKRMEWLLEQLGNPQNKICGVHVVGTNGKGSTVKALQTIFSRAGYEVGTFTSPFIVDFRERISVNGRMISKEDLVTVVERVKPVIERLPQETDLGPATEFEIITSLMFVYFGQLHPVDIVFVEAGLGGLYDSTNVFQPEVVVCTSIGLDHQDILGQTYQEIAAQKVGVLKPNVPLVFAESRDDVRAVFYDKAKETHSNVYELGKDFQISLETDRFSLTAKHKCLRDIQLAMPGSHQVRNASLAIMTSFLLQEKFPRVTDQVIKAGLKESRWLGRTELLRPNLMIDGAHNNESVAVLVDLLKQDYTSKTIHILFAAINTKPVDSMLEQLEQFKSLTVTTFDYPNALTLKDYPKSYQRIADYHDWLSQCDTFSDKDFYVVTGSLYFISQVRQWLVTSKNETVVEEKE